MLQQPLSQYYVTSTMFDMQRFQEQLTTKFIGRSFIYRKEIDSTMNLAQREVSEGSPTGTLILAERQTKGRGRKGRSWHSDLAENLYFTIIIHVNPQEPLQLLKLNFAVAAAVVQACRDEGAQETFIKWPNDVWVRRKDGVFQKMCGMLIDSIQTADQHLAACCGVGLNVNQDMELIQDKIEGNLATSLKNIMIKEISREQVLAKICNNLEMLLAEPFEVVQGIYRDFDILVGKYVTVTGNSGQRTGKAVAYSKFGNLIVEFDDDGTRSELISEEVSIRQAPEPTLSNKSSTLKTKAEDENTEVSVNDEDQENAKVESADERSTSRIENSDDILAPLSTGDMSDTLT
jgi:BirA family biotin operon repressor/biotin-[acetyl-CoA-carboxylase] ligase